MITALDMAHFAGYVLLFTRDRDLRLNGASDLSSFVPEGYTLNETVDFPHVFRKLKIMAGLPPWPAAPEETGFIEAKVGREPMRFEVRFLTMRGAEEVWIKHIATA